MTDHTKSTTRDESNQSLEDFNRRWDAIACELGVFPSDEARPYWAVKGEDNWYDFTEIFEALIARLERNKK